MQFTLHNRQTINEQPRKLSFKKETLRQLTDGQLRQVAGGNPSGGSASISVSSGTSVVSSGTSVISSGTSVISPSTSVVSH